MATHAEKVRHLERALAAGEVSYTRLLAQLFDEAREMAVEIEELQEQLSTAMNRALRAEELLRQVQAKLQRIERAGRAFTRR